MSHDDMEARTKSATEQIVTVSIFHESMTRPDGSCGWCGGEMNGVHRTILRADGVVISCAAGDARLLFVGLRLANEDRVALLKELDAQRAEVALWTSRAINDLARAKIAESELAAERARADALVDVLAIDEAGDPVACPENEPCDHKVCAAIRAIRVAHAAASPAPPPMAINDELCARCGATYRDHEFETFPPQGADCRGFQCSVDHDATGRPCPMRAGGGGNG